MTIEVTGVNTHNKGAELMLLAIRQHFDGWPDVSLAVDRAFGSYQDRAQYRLLQKIQIPRFGRAWLAAALMPAPFRRAYGLVTEQDIDAVLDASGFAFGDQHPVDRATAFATRLERARKQNNPIVLLPQAFGPFKKQGSRDAFKRIVAAADLVFARDDVSLEAATEAVGSGLSSKIIQAPDFTNLVKSVPLNGSRREGRACIVPNQRMIEKATSSKSADAYLPFLQACIESAEHHGLQPTLLVHGNDDSELAVALSEQLGHALPTIHERDPLAIRSILGACDLVIGSRFHALVSALSQGVPAIGTSWSHKYEMLFDEYGCAEMLLSVTADREEIDACVARATGAGRGELQLRIASAGDVLQKQVEDMWKRVDDVFRPLAATVRN